MTTKDPSDLLMQEYEFLAQRDLKEALKKMVDLYFDPILAESYNHEVADAIEIWLFENANKNILNYVESRFILQQGSKRLLKLIKTGMNKPEK